MATGTNAVPEHRAALWRTLLTAEMNVLYWTYVSDRCSKCDKYLKFMTAATASGTVAGWLTQFPTVWKSLSLISAFGALIQPIFFSSERLRKISETLARWRDLQIDYELLWEKDDQLRSPQAWEQYAEAKRREKHIDETELPKKPELIEKAFQEVLRKRGLPDA